MGKPDIAFDSHSSMPADLNFPGFAAPAASFEAPLEMLAACHGRIEQQLATLRRLVPHVAEHGADGEAQSAAAAVLRYFDTAAPAHHADEEEDLFPALIESMAGSDAVCIHDLTERLGAEHHELEVAWDGLRGTLTGIAAGSVNRLDAQAVEAFAARYENHLAAENQELLPMAARLIDDAALEQIGRAMRARRGIAST